MQSTFMITETDSEREQSVEEQTRKRPRRSTNACVRCKARKQRCDLHDYDQCPCRSCLKAGVACILTEKIKKSSYPDEYVKSLETRVADLESHLQTLEPSGGYGNDHWDQSSPPARAEMATSVGSSHKFSLGVANTWDSTTDDSTDESQIARGIALLSLNSAAEPHYIGASSGWSWAKTILGTLNGNALSPTSPSTKTHLKRFKNLPDFKFKRRVSPVSDRLCVPPPAIAEIFIQVVYEHIQARYPFLCWRSFKAWHTHRDRYIVGDLTEKDDRTAAFFIWLVYATGAKLLQSNVLSGTYSPEIYYHQAMEYVDTIVTLHNLANIQAFLLLSVYSLRCAEGPSVWHLVGLSTRLAVELGLHRKSSRQACIRDPYTVELRRRIFWSTYGMDRFMALTMGRPLGIQDDDIDVELPMDIDLTDSDDATLRAMSEQYFTAPWAASPAGSATPSGSTSAKSITTMSSALHVIKCRQIESKVQRLMYRVDVVVNPTDVAGEATKLLEKLDRWKTNISQKPLGEDPSSPPCCSSEWFSWRYYEVTLFLLRPFTVNASPSDPLLARCAHAAAGALEAQRRMHQTPPLSLSLSALHCVFLSGLTLLHCLHLNHRVLPPTKASKAIRACSNSLFLFAQHFVAAEPFRDAFEDMANACLDVAEEAQEGKDIGIRRADDPRMGVIVRASDQTESPASLVADLVTGVSDKASTPSGIRRMEEDDAANRLWGQQLDDMSKLMTDIQRDTFYSLVSSLGFSSPPVDTTMDLSIAPSLAIHAHQFLAPSGTMDPRTQPRSVDPIIYQTD